MIDSELADWPQLIAWFTTGPARVLRRHAASLVVGARADLTLIDPRSPWVVNPDEFCSKGRNTPFEGWTLTARSVATIRGRRISRLAPVVGTA
jgi:dihydroorotase